MNCARHFRPCSGVVDPDHNRRPVRERNIKDVMPRTGPEFSNCRWRTTKHPGRDVCGQFRIRFARFRLVLRVLHRSKITASSIIHRSQTEMRTPSMLATIAGLSLWRRIIDLAFKGVTQGMRDGLGGRKSRVSAPSRERRRRGCRRVSPLSPASTSSSRRGRRQRDAKAQRFAAAIGWRLSEPFDQVPAIREDHGLRGDIPGIGDQLDERQSGRANL
jgi:hypothetical protein